MSRTTKWVLAGTFGALCLLSALIGLSVTSVLYHPDFSLMKKKVKINIMLADRTKGSKWIGPETVDWVPMSEVSDYLIAAVISSEDTSFYSHQGVDFHELKEAIKKDIKEKRWARGASTLTQQVVKNVYLTQEKTLTRKFREILWARELEKALTKSQILCFYLNMVEWAPGLYGVKAAARHYFRKNAAELTAKESAFLAMLLPSPWRYHAYFDRKELTPWAEKALNRILNLMNKMGYIDETELNSAMAETFWGQTSSSIAADEAPAANSDPALMTGEGLSEPVTDPGPPASLDDEPAVEDPGLR